jgi:hypothetical protein
MLLYVALVTKSSQNTRAQYASTFIQCLFSRISEIEFAKLAEQLNSRLQVDPAHESVDLDNLFAFLSDVQSGRTVDSGVGDHMKQIVSDFDEVICTQ